MARINGITALGGIGLPKTAGSIGTGTHGSITNRRLPSHPNPLIAVNGRLAITAPLHTATTQVPMGIRLDTAAITIMVPATEAAITDRAAITDLAGTTANPGSQSGRGVASDYRLGF